jgi:hypothetical protein
VTDVAKSTEHYRDVLGFTVTFEYGTPTFYVCLRRDEVALHLLSASQTSRLWKDRSWRKPVVRTQISSKPQQPETF